jgi:hypothetical protein
VVCCQLRTEDPQTAKPLQTSRDKGQWKDSHIAASKQEKAVNAEEYFPQVLFAIDELINFLKWSAATESIALEPVLLARAAVGSTNFWRGKRVVIEYLSKREEAPPVQFC